MTLMNIWTGRGRCCTRGGIISCLPKQQLLRAKGKEPQIQKTRGIKCSQCAADVW